MAGGEGGCTGGEGGCTGILCIPPGYATDNRENVSFAICKIRYIPVLYVGGKASS